MSPAVRTVDVVVVGGGIAGASCGYRLGQAGLETVVLERESELGLHSTGRSAATMVPGYGGATNDQLTHLGIDFYRSDGDGLAEYPLLMPRPILLIEPADLDGEHHVIAGARRVASQEAAEVCPVLRDDAIADYWMQHGGFDIDVEGALQAMARGARAAGVAFGLHSEAIEITRRGDGWHVYAAGADYHCRVIVDAGGAWADQIAKIAGVQPAGLSVVKRTAFVSPVAVETGGLPLVLATDDSCYFKPDVPGVLMCSRSEETPAPPGSPVADEIDVAYALDRINSLTTLGLRSVRRTWAGLRVFGPDREPVVRQDDSGAPFFWCAGLGGTGIQTSPGAGHRVAELVVALSS